MSITERAASWIAAHGAIPADQPRRQLLFNVAAEKVTTAATAGREDEMQDAIAYYTAITGYIEAMRRPIPVALRPEPAK